MPDSLEQVQSKLASCGKSLDYAMSRLYEAEHEVSRLRECRDQWKAQAESLAAKYIVHEDYDLGGEG